MSLPIGSQRWNRNYVLVALIVIAGVVFSSQQSYKLTNKLPVKTLGADDKPTREGQALHLLVAAVSVAVVVHWLDAHGHLN